MFVKNKAFTIAELAIALLISSIVIGLSYYAIHLVNREWWRYQSVSSSVNEYYLLEKVLSDDVNKANRIKDSIGLISFHLSSGAQIMYKFENSRLLRKTDLHIDSFKVNIEGVSVSYVDERIKLINNIELRVNLNDNKFLSIYNKIYSAAELVKEDQGNRE